MGVMEQNFGLEATREERALRLRLLFRLLRDFNFNAPRFHGEMISDPVATGQRGQLWPHP